jgi:hypothetical protein
MPRRIETRALRRAAPLLAVLTLAACGGGGGSKTTTRARPDVDEATVSAITSADVAIFSSVNATRNIVGHPSDVARGQQLLKPLIVAKTLGVNQSNPTAGGLTQNLLDELDNTVPGLTRQGANGEELDTATVNRFLRYGSKRPAAVFHDKAAGGVAQLERLLRGKPRTLRVTPQAETAEHLVASDVSLTQRFWPDLARRLQALDRSLT